MAQNVLKKKRDGILLLYWESSAAATAPNVKDHIESFKLSKFKVYPCNVAIGFPYTLWKIEFDIILLHYTSTVFTPNSSKVTSLSNQFIEYIDACKGSYRIAFTQDECECCQQRFGLLNHLKIDCLYTLVEPEYWNATYRKYTSIPKLVHNFPAYASDTLVSKAKQFSKPLEQRTVDIGYRAREVPYHLGRATYDKWLIGEEFKKRAPAGLNHDVCTSSSSRMYGNDWFKFLGNCKGTLGVESGSTIFDLDGTIYTRIQTMRAEKPNLSFREASDKLLNQYEGLIRYLTIAPKNFESAAFANIQILYEGNYSGILKPWEHYLPLKKDWSNFGEVMLAFQDKSYARGVVNKCYHDIIESGRYSYHQFVRQFDDELLSQGLRPEMIFNISLATSANLAVEKTLLSTRWSLLQLVLRDWPAKTFVVNRILKPLLRIARRNKGESCEEPICRDKADINCDNK